MNQMSFEREVLRSGLAKKPVTLRYPYEKIPPVEGLRGKVIWDTDLCVGCGICVRDCPAFALEMIGKRMTAELKYYLGRCQFCGQCEESCPRNALKLSQEYEIADEKEIIIDWKRRK